MLAQAWTCLDTDLFNVATSCILVSIVEFIPGFVNSPGYVWSSSCQAHVDIMHRFLSGSCVHKHIIRARA
jgi:hypothetical protein